MEWILLFPLAAAWLAWRNYLLALKAACAVKQRITLVLFAVLVLFSAGFALRLSGDSSAIGLGYYFTDFSFLFAYLLIAVAALLGQAKYHS